jgi:MSHA pilin protein MshD
VKKFFTENRAFTLIEIVVFIVVFSIGAVGIMFVFGNVLGNTTDPTLRLKTVQASQAIMDEILSRKWDELTPNGGGSIDFNTATIGVDSENFSDYDDVDDYDNVSCNTKTSTNCFKVNGDFDVLIEVSFADLNSSNTLVKSITNNNYKIIKLKVHSVTLNETITLYAVKGNF